MKTIGVIPARYASTRLPGKPLVLINGKPLLSWVVESIKKCEQIDQIVVATDHEEILTLAKSLGVKGVMTDSKLATGSDRVRAAIKDIPGEIIMNIQGDEPLINSKDLDKLSLAMKANASIDMATLGRPIKVKEDLISENTAKIILNQNDEAVYFSRSAIPFTRIQDPEVYPVDRSYCLKHIGVYAFKREFLNEFCDHPQTSIEKAEGLEQLRALYLGAKIKVVQVESESWGVDTLDDIKKVGLLMSQLGVK